MFNKFPHILLLGLLLLLIFLSETSLAFNRDPCPCSKDTPNQNIITIAAAFIALVALAVAIWQGFLLRRHNRLSISPKLGFKLDISKEEPEYGLLLRNNGVGPAIIEKFQLYVDGKLIEDDGHGGWKNAFKALEIPMLEYGWWDKGQVMASEERLLLLGIMKHNLKDKRIADFRESFNRMNIVIEYSSVYEEKFSINKNDFKDEI